MKIAFVLLELVVLATAAAQNKSVGESDIVGDENEQKATAVMIEFASLAGKCEVYGFMKAKMAEQKMSKQTGEVQNPMPPIMAKPMTPMMAKPMTPLMAMPMAPMIAKPMMVMLMVPMMAQNMAPMMTQPMAPMMAQSMAPIMAQLMMAQSMAPMMAKSMAPMMAQPIAPMMAQSMAPMMAPSMTPMMAKSMAPMMAQPKASIPPQPVVGKRGEIDEGDEGENDTYILDKACPHVKDFADTYKAANETTKTQMEQAIAPNFFVMQCSNLIAEAQQLRFLGFNQEGGELKSAMLEAADPLFELCKASFGEAHEQEQKLKEALDIGEPPSVERRLLNLLKQLKY